MALTSTIAVDASRAFKKLRAEEKRIIASGRATTQELVNLGKRHARQFVPKDTFETYDAIDGKVFPQATGNTKGQVRILLRNRVRNPRDKARGKTTHDIARLMASGWVPRKSGDPKFMLRTRNYLNRIKKQIGNKNIKKGKTPSASISV